MRVEESNSRNSRAIPKSDNYKKEKILNKRRKIEGEEEEEEERDLARPIMI